MEGDIFTAFLNLGIGGAALAAMVFIVLKFLDELKRMREQHEHAMKEREVAMRDLEKEVRTNVLDQLNRNTQAMERVMLHMDTH